MKIAIIGAGISGLAAGRELAKAGHEVVIFEKSRGFGGRMATRYSGKNDASRLDHGTGYLQPEHTLFKAFAEELQAKGIVEPWNGTFKRRNAEGIDEPAADDIQRYIAPEGMNKIGKYMSRLMDIRTEEKVGGLTHIGEHRSRKRTWMLNFSSSRTESADAVILAVPSRQAYGLLNTTIDEIETLNLVREIDEVDYMPQFAYLAGYGDIQKPDWDMLEFEDDEVIERISVESSKRKDVNGISLVVHTTPEFAAANRKADREEITERIQERLSELAGSWTAIPEWSQLHFWKYSRCIEPLPHDYMEIEGKDTPLALVGDYLNGNTTESAYLSGRKLGKHWVGKYADRL